MHLLADDKQKVYVWVDDNDESKHISPHFDYEEDAIMWYNMVYTGKVNDYDRVEDLHK